MKTFSPISIKHGCGISEVEATWKENSLSVRNCDPTGTLDQQRTVRIPNVFRFQFFLYKNRDNDLYLLGLFQQLSGTK